MSIRLHLRLRTTITMHSVFRRTVFTRGTRLSLRTMGLPCRLRRRRMRLHRHPMTNTITILTNLTHVFLRNHGNGTTNCTTKRFTINGLHITYRTFRLFCFYLVRTRHHTIRLQCIRLTRNVFSRITISIGSQF